MIGNYRNCRKCGTRFHNIDPKVQTCDECWERTFEMLKEIYIEECGL